MKVEEVNAHNLYNPIEHIKRVIILQYQIGQLYSVIQTSMKETGGGEGVEILKNEPFTQDSGTQPKTPLLSSAPTSGQYTHKIYHVRK